MDDPGKATCPVCGGVYEWKHRNQVYCSTKCRNDPRSDRMVRERERKASKHRETYVPKSRKPRKRKYQPGRVGGTELELLAYDETNTNYGFFKCSCGTEKRIRLVYVFVGYPNAAQKGKRQVDCGDALKHGSKRAVERPAIGTVHHHIVKARGAAKDHPCVVCGDVTDGNQWAYRHSSLDALVQGSGKDKGQVYSTDKGDYWSLCKRHHVAWDSGIDKESVSGAHVALAMAYNPYEDAQEAL